MLLLVVVLLPGSAAALESVSDALEIVRQLEADNPSWDWTTTLTSIRKLTYDSALWNILLDAQASVPAAVPTANVTQAMLNDLSRGNNDLPSNGTDNRVLDLNHVWVGLEALQFPAMSGEAGLLGLTSNLPMATYGGDVASAVAEYTHDAATGSSRYSCDPTVSGALQCYYDVLANDADLLGDLDGIALFALPPAFADEPLSSRAGRYYNRAAAHMGCAVSAASAQLGWRWEDSPSGGRLSTLGGTTAAELRAEVSALADALIKRERGCPSNPCAFEAHTAPCGPLCPLLASVLSTPLTEACAAPQVGVLWRV